MQIERDASLQTDRVRLPLLLKNLIANSLRCGNRAQGPVEIHVSIEKRLPTTSSATIARARLAITVSW